MDEGFLQSILRIIICQQTKTFSYDECRNHNTYLELERRVTDKINEGYTLNLEQSVL